MSYFAITSNHPRHIKFIQTLQSEIDLDLIIVVSKGEVSESEKEFFGNPSTLSGDNILMCDKTQVHSRFVMNAIRGLNPDVGFVFGAPLLMENVYGIPRYGCVNIHTGLVDHYRGVDSTSWAIYDERIDLVGATLHYIDKSIDAGEVVDMRAVECKLADTSDTLFYKSCQIGFDMLRENMYNILNNKVKKIKLEKLGVLYQNKDMNSSVEMEVRNKAPRLIKEFLRENHSRSL